MYEKIKILKKITKTIIVVFMCIIFLIPLKINANNYTINDLIENGKTLDKKELIIKGEAIGEPLKRKDYTWININDTTNAIGIYMTNNDSNKVKMYGGYSKVGDTLEVKGIFNRACKEHGGDMDIHSSKVTIIKKGKKINENLKESKLYILSISSLIVILLGYIIYKKQNK